jgi:dihydroflavonol-4-reductase
MRVLITGGTGFLGSHLCRRMLQDGHEVRVLCRPTSSPATLNGASVERVLGDVTDADSVERAVQDRDWVIHAAASLSYWQDEAERQRQVNVNGTRNVVEACLRQGVRRLLHVSSVAAVGIPDDPARPATEDFPFNLQGSGLCYHLSKRQAEEIVRDGVKQGLDAVIVNPSSIFGPNGSRYRGAERLRKVRQTWLVPYFTGGLCAVHVQDVVDGIVNALVHGKTGQRYILGGENLSYRVLVERTARAMRLRRRPMPVPALVTGLAAHVLEPWGRWRKVRPRITYMIHYCASRYHYYDSTKARRELGYAPRDFEAILRECLRLNAC